MDHGGPAGALLSHLPFHLSLLVQILWGTIPESWPRMSPFGDPAGLNTTSPKAIDEERWYPSWMN